MRAVQLPIRPHLYFVRTNNTPKCHRRRRGHPRLPHIQPPRTYARVAVKNTEYCFCCVKRQKHEVSKRKDLFFSTKISRVLLSMVVTFCGYPRYLCAQAEACGGVDGGGMTPTICLCRKKGGKLTAMHANSFFYARQVSLFFCLSALWIRL